MFSHASRKPHSIDILATKVAEDRPAKHPGPERAKSPNFVSFKILDRWHVKLSLEVLKISFVGLFRDRGFS